MAAVAEKLTLVEFERKYERGERAYEYWRGEAIAKAVPTWMHGLLQGILVRLLTEAGYVAGSEIELRIDPERHPKPDVIATTGDVEQPYPTKAVEVVVEILSKDDPMPYVIEKCKAYRRWGFEHIYVLHPEGNQLFRWTESALALTDTLTTISASRIWEELEKALRKH